MSSNFSIKGTGQRTFTLGKAGNNTLATLDSSGITANRNYAYPDKSGTIALVSDLSGISAGLETLWIPAASMASRKSAGCSQLIRTEVAAAQPNINSLNFDPAVQQYAQFDIAMPKSWNLGTITYEILWVHPATTVNFGVVWGLSAVALSPGADLIGTNFGTEVDTTSTGGTTYKLYSTGVSGALTVGNNPAVGDLVYFQVTRVAANASDTLAVNAFLLGVKIYYTSNSLNDN